MTSVILHTVARLLVPLQLAFSLYLLLRGHNEPGGGFAAALVAGAALALYSIANSPEATRRLIRLDPVAIAGVGLAVALASGAVGLLAGQEFMAGYWLEVPLLHWEFGTPLLFDVGVYVLVIGVTSAILLTVMEGR